MKLKNNVLNQISLSLVMTLVSGATLASEIKVSVASNSPVKKEAVQKAFQAHFSEDEISITSYAAPSGIANQPVRKEYGILGAWNRLVAAHQLASSADEAHYWVSIENYVEPSDDESDPWIDQAAIFLQKGSQAPVLVYSQAVSFESHSGMEAKKRTPIDYPYLWSGFKVTVGEIIQEELAERGEIVSHDDWHQKLGGTSRQDLLQQAITQAIKNAEKKRIPDFSKKPNSNQES